MKKFLGKIPCRICKRLISNAGFAMHSHMMAHVRRGEATKDGMGFKTLNQLLDLTANGCGKSA